MATPRDSFAGMMQDHLAEQGTRFEIDGGAGPGQEPPEVPAQPPRSMRSTYGCITVVVVLTVLAVLLIFRDSPGPPMTVMVLGKTFHKKIRADHHFDLKKAWDATAGQTMGIPASLSLRDNGPVDVGSFRIRLGHGSDGRTLFFGGRAKAKDATKCVEEPKVQLRFTKGYVERGNLMDIEGHLLGSDGGPPTYTSWVFQEYEPHHNNMAAILEASEWDPTA